MPETQTDHPPRAVPVLATPSLAHPAILVPLLCVGLPAAGLFLALPEGERGVSLAQVVLGALAVGCLGGPLFAAAVLLIRRRWVEATLDGFLVHSFRRARAIRDEEVSGLLLDESLSGPTRVVLTVEQQGRRTSLRFLYASATDDPLSLLWQRLVQSLARRAREHLDQPSALAGKQWVIGEGRLLLLAQQRSIDLREVRQARLVDDEACLWVGDEVRPSIRLPAWGRNVRVLVRLVRLLCEERGETGPPHDPDADPLLGPLVADYEVRPPWRGLGWLLLVGTAPVAGCFVPPIRLYLAGAPEAELVFMTALVTTAGFGAILIQFYGVHLLTRTTYPGRLALHRDGLVLTLDGRRRALAYDDIDGLTWGRPLVFTPAAAHPGLEALPLRFDGNPRDEELARMRDRVARRLARRRLEELRAGRAVPWTNAVGFRPEGLECHWRNWRGIAWRSSGPPRLLPYEAVRPELRGALLYLRDRERGYILCATATSKANFYVGLALLEMVQEEGLG